MTKKLSDIKIPLNRAEGDLEVHVDVQDGLVSEARSSGTMFRGFEEMMLGRGALDGLVITPRICGICSLTHLNAAVEALDAITGVEPPDNARRLRNVSLMIETVQSDVRHAALMFMVDFAHPQAYKDHSFFKEALHRYEPMKGRITHEVIRETKKLLKVVAIIGGQWPHTSFMVPGGVVSMPDTTRLLQCRMIIKQFVSWYEQIVLGCSLERWQEIQSVADLDNWLDENIEHRQSEVGFLLSCAREAKLDAMGVGPRRFLSYGSLTLPKESSVTGNNGRLVASGFAEGTTVHPFKQEDIVEDVSHGFYTKSKTPLHPFKGKTIPKMAKTDKKSYSWVKAPRYDSKVVETGPLAEMIIGKNTLFHDLLKEYGPNVMVRQLARLTRPVSLLPAMLTWLSEVNDHYDEDFYTNVDTVPDGSGAGLIQAARGALGHWVKVKDQKITQYQVITPSAWNGSPRDSAGARGAWEEALINTPIRDHENPVEAGHVIRSFDPCLVCAVHLVKKK